MDSDLNPVMAAAVDYLVGPDTNKRNDSSATWTTSSGDMGLFSDSDDIEDRVHFVDEYNRLAKNHMIRLLVQEDLETCPDADRTISQERKTSWFRALIRDVSGSSYASSTQSVRKVSSKRSLSDIASHIIHPKRDGLKDEDLQTLVRLCGKSKFYLPSEYAPASLVLPTCFRATAQYLVQHGTETRGIFSNPGSAKVVSAIYDHYCPTQDEANTIDTTVSSPNLPSHFKASVHDVASVFKKFLAGLPGGILGSLALFDAFVAIHSQLQGDAEFNRTKQSKLRARLIALAIGTVKSQYRRELICAVFGLLSLIGRTAEKTPREDDLGRPLSTSDLMGYNALGKIFGPFLVGNLLVSYTMKLANPNEGLILLPVSPPRPRRTRSGRRSKGADERHPLSIVVDKTHVANGIAEMVITHWREVVKHLRSLGALRTHKEVTAAEPAQSHMNRLRPSASESFMIRQPADWNNSRPPSVYVESPLPRRRSFSSIPEPISVHADTTEAHEPLLVRRKRPKSGRTTANNRLTGKTPRPVLSPTVEEAGSPYPQSLGAHEYGMPSVGTPLEKDMQESHQDTDLETPVQTQSTQKPGSLAISHSCSDPVEPSGGPSQRVKKLRSSHRAKRVRRDTPAPKLPKRNSLRGVCEMARMSSVTARDDTQQELQPDSTANSVRLTTEQQPQQHPASGPTDSFAQGMDSAPESEARTPWVHSGAFPETPGVPQDFSETPYVHPGAFPPSPAQEVDCHAVEPAEPEEKLSGGSLRRTFKKTMEEASSHLVRGMSSAASTLAEVFNPPSSEPTGATSPSKIPAPYGTLRRNRPSYRRLKKKRVPQTPPTQVTGGSEQRSREPPATEEQLQPPATDTLDKTDKPDTWPWTTPSNVPDSSQRTSSNVVLTGVKAITALFENVSRDMSTVGTPAQATEPHPETTQQGTNASSQKEQEDSYFPSNDGNQSASVRSQAHIKAAHHDERSQPNNGNFTTPAQQKSSQILTQSTTSDQPTTTPRPNTRSVRRLSNLFKGLHRSSTTTSRATPVPSKSPLTRRSSLPSSPPPASPFPHPDPIMLRNPGTMTPYHDHSGPLGTHISRRLPPRSVTPSTEAFPPVSTTPSGMTNNAALYAQVLALQRALVARTEEVVQLRRQLEAVRDGEAGELSERLRVAEREVRMWKERAVAAERRVVVFERFLGRVRGLREKRGVGGGSGEGLEEEVEREMRAGGEVEGQGQVDGEGRERGDGCVWMAAREVVEYDDMRRWLSGGC